MKRFDLYIVYKDPEEHFFTEIKELNEKYSSMTAKINGKLEVVPDPTCMYNIFATHDYECRQVRDLFSSTIIYDPDGFYYKAAHQFDRYNTVQKYTNVLDINMSIIK